MLKFYIKTFYVIGKALLGSLTQVLLLCMSSDSLFVLRGVVGWCDGAG